MYIDFATQEGVKIKAAFEARLVELSRRLESIEMTDAETHRTRGMIAEIRNWLKVVPTQTQVPRYSGNVIDRRDA